MSRFFSEKYAALTPYTPGEQPRDQQYVKLNTNESPFPPSPKAQSYAAKEAQTLRLYSDPTCDALVRKAAAHYGVNADELLFTNGSDEILNFAFMAFCDDAHPAVFPNITYGFYPVFAALNNVPYRTVSLAEDFTVRVEDYLGAKGTVFLANPNAPTGVALTRAQIEEILKANPENVVVVDEAYVDFGAETCVPLVQKYDNLLVTQTFSKSRSLAGGRLGVGIGAAALIQDLNTIKYSTNPYNVNRMTMAAGVGALEDEDYTQKNCREIIRVREMTANALASLGFTMTDSTANFLFVKHPAVAGLTIYQELKKKGVLVRHFETPLLRDYNRVTVGSEEQMKVFLAKIKEVLEEAK